MDEVQLKDFIHAQWGTIVGQENKIRVTVLKEEIEVFRSRIEPHDTQMSIFSSAIFPP